MVKKYKVKAYCRSCRKTWTTRAKDNSKAPARCKFCDSKKTKTKTAWPVKR